MRAWKALLLVLAAQVTVHAKRGPAPRIEPLLKDGIRFVVPNDDGRRGYVQAQEAEGGRILWEATLFRIQVSKDLEEDVQWVFIAKAKLEGRTLLLVDERQRTYALDIRKKTVRRVQGHSPGRPRDLNKN